MEPFVGQIMQVGFDFAPRGWAKCWNQQIAVNQQMALFSLIGTTFGGNGTTTFALPDTRGRMTVGTGQLPGGSFYNIGQVAGTENTTLLLNNMPIHNHGATFTSTSTLNGALQAMSGLAYPALAAAPTEGAHLGTISETDTVPHLYVPAGTSGGAAVNLGGFTMSGAVSGNVAVANSGGSVPFSILSPYVALNTIIAMEGVFPSRN